jgi:hypothetical protein
MQYFFVLGRHPILSLAELKTYYHANYHENIKLDALEDNGEIGIASLGNASLEDDIK